MAADKLQLQVVLSALQTVTGPLKKIQGGSIGAARALKETRDRLKELNAQQKDVSTWRAQREAAEQSAQAIQANRDNVRQLSRELASHQQAVQPLQASYDALNTETTALVTKHKALQQQMREGREQARAANQVWQENRKRIRELGQQIGSTATPSQKLRDEYAALVTQQKSQLELVRRLSAGQKELQQQHQASATSTREHKQRLADLSAQLLEAKAPMQALNQQFKAGVREAQALKQKHREQQEQLQGLRAKLNAAGISTRNLSEGERDLRAKIAATNNAMGQQEARLKRIATQQRRLAQAKQAHERSQGMAGSMATSGAAGLASGYALARPLKGIVDAFAPAENAATQLKVSMMGSDGSVSADFQKITELANTLGDRLPGTTADFQEMMTMLRRQGLSAANILGGTGEAAAYLGVQLQMPVTAAAEFAAKMQDATRTSEKDMMGLMDTIQRTFYMGVDSDNMLQGFSKISPVMDIIKKQGLEATKVLTPLLVMMDQAGMEGGAAGNAYRKIFQGAMNTGRIDKALDGLKAERGINLKLDFTNGKGEFGGIDKMYAQLDKLKDLSTEVRLQLIKDMFGDDSETLTTLNTMMAKGVAGYRDVEGKLQAQADLRKRVNEQLGTLTNVMEAAQGSWSNAMAEIGLTIAPELKDFITWLGEIAVKVKAWVKENPQLTAQIVKTAAGLALLLAAGGSLSVMLASVLGPIALVRYGLMLFGIKSLGMLSAVKGLGTALMWFGRIILFIGRALLMNPIGLAITAIALAAYLIYKYWEPIKGFFLGLWAEIKAGFDGGLAGILQLLVNFSPIGLFYRAFAAVMSYFGIELPSKFTEFGANLMQGMVNGITQGLASVKTAITGAADNTVTWFKEKLGIHSPSRVFASLGGFTMAGLTQGLAGGEGDVLGQIASTARSMTSAGAAMFGIGTEANGISIDSRPPVAAAGGGMTIQGDTYEININAGPGTDIPGLRQMLNQLLDERERNKATRLRGRFGDQE